ncbi:MAG: polysaccharide biosynthesis C-terminal domain-containing protein [Bacteroidetes bacterium]|nr:polysaccharide biosynthesis C-terminal domain-containing protein [Bacteroidota bacterium]
MVKKIIHTFGTKLLTAIINLLIVIVISQFIGAAGKGEQGILITTIALILIFSNIVGGASLVYLTPRIHPKKLIGPAYIWTAFVSIIFYFILANLNIVESKYAIHIALLSAINSFASINSSILIGKEKITTNNFINLLQTLLIIVFLIVFFYFLNQRNVLSYIWSLYLAFSISFITSFILIFRFLISKQEVIIGYFHVIKELFKYGILNQLAHIAQLLSFRFSYYVLNYYSGTSEVGVYSNGVSLVESIWMVSGSIALVQYSKIANTDDIKYSQRLTTGLIKISLLSASIIMIPMLILPSEFFSFIFGKEFGPINQVMWSLAPGVLFFNFALVLGHYFSGTGKYYVNTIASVIGLVITIGLSFILIPKYSIIGAGITSSISYIFTSIFVIFFFCKESEQSYLNLLPNFSDVKGYFLEIKKYIKT